MVRAKGIDVSHWQSQVDWVAVRNAGIAFAFIKATEQANHVDRRFQENWAGAKAAGVLRGAYHFFRPGVDAKDQARHFATTVGELEARDLPPVLDLEVRDGVSNETLVKGVHTWLQEVERLTGRRPIIYTGPSFWDTHIAEGGNPPPWSQHYSLWIANYQVPKPFLPAGFLTWTFWQFTEKGQIPGVDGNVDMNWFNGSQDDLFDFLGIDALPDNRPYRVKPTDNLFTIAARFGVTLEALLKANPELLQPDMEIKIPLTQVALPTAKFYTIQPGDNLTLIAQRFNTTLDALVKTNNIHNPDEIEVGRVLKIP